MRVQPEASAMRPMGSNQSCRCKPQPNRKVTLGRGFRSNHLPAGYSLIEVCVATGIIALVYGSCIKCYMQSGLRAEWGWLFAGRSIPGHEQIEQARSAIWDPSMGTSGKKRGDQFGPVLAIVDLCRQQYVVRIYHERSGCPLRHHQLHDRHQFRIRHAHQL